LGIETRPAGTGLEIQDPWHQLCAKKSIYRPNAARIDLHSCEGLHRKGCGNPSWLLTGKKRCHSAATSVNCLWWFLETIVSASRIIVSTRLCGTLLPSPTRSQLKVREWGHYPWKQEGSLEARGTHQLASIDPSRISSLPHHVAPTVRTGQ
jgi:hypothetical protein